MASRTLGRTDLRVSPIGYGAFKIGRNQKIKYAESYPLPSDAEVTALLDALCSAGINYFDTAPAYGSSEARLGAFLPQNANVIISTKVGEIFEDGVSRYDFSVEAVEASVARSMELLQRSVLDLVFVHAHADDLAILRDTPVVGTLQRLQSAGQIRYLGFSGKTPEAAGQALGWADALMVEYHLEDRSHADVIAEAAEQGVGVVVKKALAAGRLSSEDALRFALETPGVDSVVIGSLRAENMLSNLAVAAQIRG